MLQHSHAVGRRGLLQVSNDTFGGYLTEVNFIDGQALDPTETSVSSMTTVLGSL
jgi:hypothetical protein